MKERRACPECGGEVEPHGAPGAYYCPECDDIMMFDVENEGGDEGAWGDK